MVEVRLFAYFREAAGREKFDIDAGNVAELIDKLIAQCRKLSDLIFESYESYVLDADVMILVNGINIEGLNSLKTRLKKNDIVSIFPPLCGG